jgi:uncharacterized protein (TIGR02246 family)
MPAHTPEEVFRLYTAAFNKGDLEEVMALYEAHATFVPQPGQVATGHEAIRHALRGFLALKPRITSTVMNMVQAGDVALVVSNWSLTGSNPDGTPMTMGGRSIDVLGRRADGAWLVVIDNPFGAP